MLYHTSVCVYIYIMYIYKITYIIKMLFVWRGHLLNAKGNTLSIWLLDEFEFDESYQNVDLFEKTALYFTHSI